MEGSVRRDGVSICLRHFGMWTRRPKNISWVRGSADAMVDTDRLLVSSHPGRMNQCIYIYIIIMIIIMIIMLMIIIMIIMYIVNIVKEIAIAYSYQY